METFQRDLQEYETPDGHFPFTEWLEALSDKKTRARIKRRVTRVSLGNFGDCESVGEGILELREHFGPGYRIYCADVGNAIILLLCGRDKSSQDEDIKRAKEYISDYRRQTNA